MRAASTLCTQTGLTDLVGRDEELELLLRRWSKAKSGEGQVVLLSGEPGIGKSRLTAALLEQLANRTAYVAALLLLAAAHRQHSLSLSLSKWNARRGLRTTIRCKPSSTSSMHCWRKVATIMPTTLQLFRGVAVAAE